LTGKITNLVTLGAPSTNAQMLVFDPVVSCIKVSKKEDVTVQLTKIA
jgi:hypothetical protein